MSLPLPLSHACSVNTAQLVDDAITNAKIATNAITGDVLAANAITENKLASNAVTADKINANAVTSAKIAANAITAAKIAAGTITATEIASGTITASQINVGTLAVQKFDDVTAQIINHNGNTVPLTRFASDYKTTGNSGGSGVSTHVPVDVTNCRSGGSFVAYIQGILGNVQNMQVEFSVDGGSTYNVAANGPVFTISAGTFRPHTFLYHDTLNFTGTNQTGKFRIRFNGNANYTQIGLTVIVDNTN